jgi:DNA-binding response OmpR family regulator
VKKINKVLLIDDDPITNQINKRLFDQLDFAKEVLIKESAKDAIEYLQSDCYLSKEYPSLILLDLSMPELNGFDFLKEFEKLKLDKKNIAIVILTNSTNGDDILKLKEMGRYYFFSKPLTVDKLVDIHHRYFRRSSFWAIFS